MVIVPGQLLDRDATVEAMNASPGCAWSRENGGSRMAVHRQTPLASG